MIGKVPHELLEAHILGRTGAADDRVLQGPAYGEDTGAIELEDSTLVVSTDPISLAVGRLGTLGVTVACNDVAASGADPDWLTVSMFLPDDDPEIIQSTTEQLDQTARALEVAIVSGHSEYMPALQRPMLVLTAFGLTDRYIPAGGAEDGDRILMTKTAATEGTAILASDFAEQLTEVVDAEVIELGRTYYDRLSVLEEARLLSSDASAMHDPTEGGLINGLIELAHASSVHLDVDPASIPISPETRALTDAAGVDPTKIFGSGVLLATIPEQSVEAATDHLTTNDIPTAIIGTVRDADTPGVTVGEQPYSDPIRDEMYGLWE